MRIGWFIALLLAALVGMGAIPARVFFSPRGGCTAVVVSALGSATNSILVQAYSFTSAPIARALVDAARRGLKVYVVLDKSQRSERYSSADFLRNSGIPTYIDDRHAIAHNKVMILDQSTVITGSFNFTTAAEESNAENLLILQDQGLAGEYFNNWRLHQAHSKPYLGKMAPKKPVRPRPKRLPAHR